MVELYEFQKEAVEDLITDKRICVLPTGSGKSAVMMTWLKSTGRENVLILTTPSKQRSGDFERDADTFCGEQWKASLSSFQVLSWAKLYKWWKDFIAGRNADQVRKELGKWAIAYDEIAYAKNGVSSQRGKAFLQISNYSDCWTGYTATPGDNWLQFYPYFQATKLTKNKTAFKMEFAVEQTYPFPKIVKWLKQDRLVEMWNMISTRPDSSSVMGQLPKENYKTITFKPSADYKNALKTRHTADGEFLDSNMALMHYIRQACWTNQKKEWLHDFIENLETGTVVFFTYTKEGDDICEMVKKLGRKAWRIDGKHHQIPTKDTIGEKDIVVCQWQSGAEALNLQFMNYWVSVSPQYSYTTYTQALGRIKRIGQELPMFFYEMVTCATIETDITKCLRDKRDFVEDLWCSEHNIEGD